MGEGGKKRVYLAHDTSLGRDVAVSQIKTGGSDDPGQLRVRHEAEAMAKLGDHPNVVTVFDIGDEAGQLFIVSEFMGGGDVEGRLKAEPDGYLPLEDVGHIEILLALADPFEYQAPVVDETMAFIDKL